MNSIVTKIRVTEAVELMKCCFLFPPTRHKKCYFYNIQNSYVHVQPRKSTKGDNSREIRIMGPNGMDTGSVSSSFVWDSKEAAQASINRDGYYLITERKKCCCMHETLTHFAEWRKPYIKTYWLQDYRTCCCSKNILRQAHILWRCFICSGQRLGWSLEGYHDFVLAGARAAQMSAFITLHRLLRL